MRSVVLAGIGVGLAAFGCTTESRGHKKLTAAGSGCDLGICGSNSPDIDDTTRISFHELNLKGLPNAQGLRIARFVQGATEYAPRVAGGRLSGRNAAGAIAGAELVGSELVLADDTGHELSIVIAGVHAVSPWTRRQSFLSPSPVPTIETYDLRWADAGAELAPVCGGSGRARDAVLFEGDRIDAVRKTIDPTIDPDWFNIGCEGGTLADLALSGYTEATSGYYHSRWESRQALLKMLVGDYCGNGTSFTVSGQPLYWSDHRYLAFLGAVQTPVEARWSSQGATCIGQPRLDAHPPSALPDGLSGPVIDAIWRACPELPPCGDDDPDHLDGADLVSANPATAATTSQRP